MLTPHACVDVRHAGRVLAFGDWGGDSAATRFGRMSMLLPMYLAATCAYAFRGLGVELHK